MNLKSYFYMTFLIQHLLYKDVYDDNENIKKGCWGRFYFLKGGEPKEPRLIPFYPFSGILRFLS